MNSGLHKVHLFLGENYVFTDKLLLGYCLIIPKESGVLLPPLLTR